LVELFVHLMTAGGGVEREREKDRERAETENSIVSHYTLHEFAPSDLTNFH
jgi:hypothetical protein